MADNCAFPDCVVPRGFRGRFMHAFSHSCKHAHIHARAEGLPSLALVLIVARVEMPGTLAAPKLRCMCMRMRMYTR
eukprot:6097848-Alexandrium_andersonii.AAC.1